MDGFPLNLLLTGKSDSSRPETFLMHFPHSHRSDYFTCYRSGEWKVIYHYFPSAVSGNSHYQIYNLAKDPFESTDLAKEQPGKLREMMQGLMTALDKTSAVYPVDKEGQAQKPTLPPAAELK